MEKSHYLLPSHPDNTCDERFGLTETESDEVLFWSIVQALLKRDVNSTEQLTDILDTIAVTLRNRSLPDYHVLREQISSWEGDFFPNIWPALARLALDLSTLFPDGYLLTLNQTQSHIEFSRQQVACLIVHQFLCTLRAPIGRDDFYDFSIWYSSTQPHPTAGKIYLTALFRFFERLVKYPESLAEWPVQYELVSGPKQETCDPFQDFEVLRLPVASMAPEYLGLPDGAAVISANKVIGFGQTGTQEEVNVGASPEACPAVLITPTLGDEQVLVVRGAEAMIRIAGYGRDVSLDQVLVWNQDEKRQGQLWKNRTMLFMDAMELDICEVDKEGDLADFLLGNVARDLKKAQIAFSSGTYSHVSTGFWGCRAFGGNPDVKIVIQWCAASMAGTRLRLVCSNPHQIAFGDRFEEFVSIVLGRGVSVNQVVKCLIEMKPDVVLRQGKPVLTILQEALSKQD